jgi:hypothetical protein
MAKANGERSSGGLVTIGSATRSKMTEETIQATSVVVGCQSVGGKIDDLTHQNGYLSHLFLSEFSDRRDFNMQFDEMV